MIQQKTLIDLDQILVGDSLTILRDFESDSIDLVINSPPYFQQRNYGNIDLGIGDDEDEDTYLQNILAVFAECVRVNKDTGTIVFNLGDKYINGGLAFLPYKFAIQATQINNIFWVNQLIWSKLNPTPRQDKRKLIQSVEPFFISTCAKLIL